MAVAPVPWSVFETEQPTLADLVAGRFAAHPHHVLGTLGPDGSPRLSGINVMIDDGELWIGSMPGAVKAADLRRDRRFALHSAPLDETLAAPDVKIRGVAVALDGAESQAWLARYQPKLEPPEGDVFLLQIRDVVVVTVVDDRLRTTRWDPEVGTAVGERS